MLSYLNIGALFLLFFEFAVFWQFSPKNAPGKLSKNWLNHGPKKIFKKKIGFFRVRGDPFAKLALAFKLAHCGHSIDFSREDGSKTLFGITWSNIFKNPTIFFKEIPYAKCQKQNKSQAKNFIFEKKSLTKPKFRR